MPTNSNEGIAFRARITPPFLLLNMARLLLTHQVFLSSRFGSFFAGSAFLVFCVRFVSISASNDDDNGDDYTNSFFFITTLLPEVASIFTYGFAIFLYTFSKIFYFFCVFLRVSFTNENRLCDLFYREKRNTQPHVNTTLKEIRRIAPRRFFYSLI